MYCRITRENKTNTLIRRWSRPEGNGHRVALRRLRPAAIIKLLKYLKRTVYDITKK
ncbi:Hypothetical protein FKW44_008550 [Caligus rogercresseyi]|uniref:Uncharacterized protein n=1 Tax=Caligus rogercresseyi TaxID=217165 RepID=A0A7T8KGA7_CALRO|nr:Hypothetical protein FKW44_008550 [Caligus rogercresseyi]